ncbi:ATP-binding protein [Streptomyces lusitanus]|uniref:histidine kinase n=1 Tax=Streptomyces lusitanus TaxID=68232 RepID=A0ABU3JSZ5_9ACTN|nr:ATP-binding protein [Streptomyces lusitanus]
MTSPLLPGDRPAPRSLLSAPVLTAAFCAVAVVAAFFLVPDAAIDAVLVTGVVASVLLCAAVTVAAYGHLSARAARERLEAVTQDVGRLLQERSRTTEEARRRHELLTGELTRERARLTAELDQERARLAEALADERDRLTEQHAAELARLAHERAEERTRTDDAHTAELARAAERHTAELDRLTAQHNAELRTLAEEHTEERDRLREERDRLTRERTRLSGENARLATRLREAEGARSAALAATANAAGRMQALATGMLADLRAMEERHHDEEVLADLLHLDHRTAQAGRVADSVAVLTGARSGRRWARPIPMESILRGAMGRIAGYQRVRVHSASDTSVAGHAAEGVMHALAELLDNAANFSPPTAEVHVYVEEVPAGVIVSVEDSGLVMGEAQQRRAERAVSGASAELGGLTGTRLGLAVVGRLARRYGLRVSYRPSARGGTGVLVLLPRDILVAGDAAPVKPVPQVLTAAVREEAEAAGVRDGGSSGTGDDRSADSTDDQPAATQDAEPSATQDDAQDLPPRRPMTEPEPLHGATDDTDSPETVRPAIPVPAPVLPAPSYAAARSGGDVDADPVPAHASAEADADAPPLVLPRRRRGRTLAEAERRSGVAARAPETRPTPTPPTPPTAPTAEETRARTARFTSFRQAVRTPTPDDTADPDAGATPPRATPPRATTPDPSTTLRPTPVTSEGDTTS